MNLKELQQVKPARHSRAFLAFIVILFLIASLAGYYTYYYTRFNLSITKTTDLKMTSTPTLTLTLTPTPTPDPLPKALRLNILWFGFVFWGRYVNDWSQASPLKEAYPFSGLSTFEKEKYNAWIANLDCPITDKIIDSKTMDETLVFNCTPNYLPEARKWFDAFNLANSHTSNMEGLKGFETTRKYLDSYGIQYFGHYDKKFTDQICEVMSFETFEEYEDSGYAPKKGYKMPIAVCGYHNTFSLANEEQLNVITKYSKYFPTFVVGIQGTEYNTIPDNLQRDTFRKMIDKGGDVLVGASAHVVQAAESYKGKLIFYSMGNFIFDQQSSEFVRSGAALNTDLTFTFDENLENYTFLAEECTSYPDNCLKKAAELNLMKPKFKIYYDLIPTDNSEKLAKKADHKIREIVLKRANWEQVLKQLSLEL